MTLIDNILLSTAEVNLSAISKMNNEEESWYQVLGQARFVYLLVEHFCWEPNLNFESFSLPSDKVRFKLPV